MRMKDSEVFRKINVLDKEENKMTEFTKFGQHLCQLALLLKALLHLFSYYLRVTNILFDYNQ